MDKKYIKVLILVIVFIVLLTGAYFCYNYLISNYDINSLSTTNNNLDTSLNTSINNNYQVVENGTSSNETNKIMMTDFFVYTYENKKINLSDYKGKPIVVNFFATWCPPCKAELPSFENLYKKYGEDVEFIMVNLTDGYSQIKEDVKDFIDENKYTFPVYYDIDFSAANAYKIYSIPETLFIDKEGNIVYTHVGMISEIMLEEKINEIMK